MKQIILAFSMFFVLSSVSYAECNSAYKDEIKTLEGRMNPPRTTVLANLVGEGALIGTMIVLTGAVSTTAVLALPVAAVGAGTYYGILIAKRDGLRNAMHVIRDAHKGSGMELDRLMRLLNKKQDNQVNRDAVISFLINEDLDSHFCEQNEKTDAYKLMSFRKILKHTKEHLAEI